jgi:hypothetical protein
MQCLVTTARWEDQKRSKGMSESEWVSILQRGVSLFRLLYDVRPDIVSLLITDLELVKQLMLNKQHPRTIRNW